MAREKMPPGGGRWKVPSREHTMGQRSAMQGSTTQIRRSARWCLQRAALRSWCVLARGRIKQHCPTAVSQVRHDDAKAPRWLVGTPERAALFGCLVDTQRGGLLLVEQKQGGTDMHFGKCRVSVSRRVLGGRSPDLHGRTVKRELPRLCHRASNTVHQPGNARPGLRVATRAAAPDGGRRAMVSSTVKELPLLGSAAPDERILIAPQPG